MTKFALSLMISLNSVLKASLPAFLCVCIYDQYVYGLSLNMFKPHGLMYREIMPHVLFASHVLIVVMLIASS